jgi:hypothetical protein
MDAMKKLNEKGQILILVTIGFVLLGIFTGLVIDMGRGYLMNARLQRVVDAASIAAANALKGQVANQALAEKAARDAAEMNGFTCCSAGSDLLIDYVPKNVGGGADVLFVQITGNSSVPTTFSRLLNLVSAGDFNTLAVAAFAEAGPERPVDLMMVLDRSGSMTELDGTGQTKLAALKCALTGLNCGGSGFLDLNFGSQDQLGMTSFGKRGCGTSTGAEFNGNICSPNVSFGSGASHISTIQTRIDALPPSGTTNTMEGLRTARLAMAPVVNDPARAAARHVVLLVTDGQPTALRLDSIAACQNDPITGAPLGGPVWTDGNGCYFVKRGGSTDTQVSDGLTRFKLDNSCEGTFTFPTPIVSPPRSGSCGTVTASGSGSPNVRYLNQMAAVRNAARDEARTIRELGGGNVLIFVIAIGHPTLSNDATARLDANARCLLAQIANEKALIESASTNNATGSCAAVYNVGDGDNHADLKVATPAGTPAAFNPAHQEGKVFTVDLSGNVQTQLQDIFAQIAALLKLRLTI